MCSITLCSYLNKYASPDLKSAQFAAKKQSNFLILLVLVLQEWNWRSKHPFEECERLGGIRRVSRREEVFVPIFFGGRNN